MCIAYFSKNADSMKVAEKQVASNAHSLALSFEGSYGAAVRDSLFRLLSEHSSAIRVYLLATAAGDVSSIEAAAQSIELMSKEMATLLSKADPGRSNDAIYSLLVSHGREHIRQIQDLKEERYDVEAKTWESMKQVIYEIADTMAASLAKQPAQNRLPELS
jgi:hypothetical protein